MAPVEVKGPAFPDTLPEDFAEWDSGEAQAQAPASAPVKQTPVERARPAEARPPAAAKVAPREPERPAAPPPVVRSARPAPPAPPKVEKEWEPAARPKPTSAPAKQEYAPASARRAAEPKRNEARWADKEREDETASESAPRSHRGMAITVGAVVVCAGLGAGYALYTWHSHTPQHPQTVAETSAAGTAETAGTKPDPRNAMTSGAPAVTAQANAAQTQNPANPSSPDASQANAQPNAQQANAPQTVNMAQFTAASQIPRGGQGAAAPAPSGNLNMAAGNGMGGAMFNAPSGHVQFAPSGPIEVASGVLSPIKKTMPDYPAIARNMHVSGVVTVAVTITPQGTVAQARPVAGPTLLRDAAANAVKAWRFRPYLVNNHPVEVLTNVNINFAMQ